MTTEEERVKLVSRIISRQVREQEHGRTLGHSRVWMKVGLGLSGVETLMDDRIVQQARSEWSGDGSEQDGDRFDREYPVEEKEWWMMGSRGEEKKRQGRGQVKEGMVLVGAAGWWEDE